MYTSNSDHDDSPDLEMAEANIERMTQRTDNSSGQKNDERKKVLLKTGILGILFILMIVLVILGIMAGNSGVDSFRNEEEFALTPAQEFYWVVMMINRQVDADGSYPEDLQDQFDEDRYVYSRNPDGSFTFTSTISDSVYSYTSDIDEIPEGLF
ncbi:MAG: hypothetical protein K8S15_07410 [Candidatus Aegiribacteria sp.]|nr:hypothetical protein [Candidatus Aegiribacteria sp.]